MWYVIVSIFALVALADLKYKTVFTGIVKCLVFGTFTIAVFPIAMLATFEAKAYYITVVYVILAIGMIGNIIQVVKRYKAKKVTPQS